MVISAYKCFFKAVRWDMVTKGVNTYRRKDPRGTPTVISWGTSQGNGEIMIIEVRGEPSECAVSQKPRGNGMYQGEAWDLLHEMLLLGLLKLGPRTGHWI